MELNCTAVWRNRRGTETPQIGCMWFNYWREIQSSKISSLVFNSLWKYFQHIRSKGNNIMASSRAHDPASTTTSILLFLCHLFTINFSLPPFFPPSLLAFLLFFLPLFLPLFSFFLNFLNNNQGPHLFSLWTTGPESLFLTWCPVANFIQTLLAPCLSFLGPHHFIWLPVAARIYISQSEGLLWTPEFTLPGYRCKRPHKFRELTLPKSGPQWLTRGYMNNPVMRQLWGMSTLAPRGSQCDLIGDTLLLVAFSS